MRFAPNIMDNTKSNSQRRIKAMLLILLIPLLLSIASTAAAGTVDAGFVATYELKRNSLTIGVTRRQLLQQPDGTFLYTSNTTAKGLFALLFSGTITERSEIQLHSDDIRPLNYLYDQKWGNRQRRYTLRFDWDNNMLHSHYKNKNAHYPLPGRAQDLLSFQIAVMRDLQHDQREIAFSIAGRKRPNHYAFRLSSKQVLKTALGPLDVVKLDQAVGSPAHDGDRFTLWCAEKLDFLPVRIEHVEDDGTVYLLNVKTYRRSVLPRRNDGN